MRRITKIKIAAVIILLLFLCSGCSNGAKKERYEVNYTVCDKTKLPDELSRIIDEKKQNSFKISYVDNSYMYIAVGYGERNRADYRVVVEDLYTTDSAVYMSTNLFTENLPRAEGEVSGEGSMYPYIVVKCERYDLPVIYDVK